jgi:seryl-tRNA synthetase
MTESYHDTQMELETQKALMERLRQLVTSAASLTEILELESQIASTQYSIDRLQGRLNAVDRKVAYSTVNVTLKEEKEAQAAVDTNRSLLSRMGDAFVGGLQSLGEFLQELLVTLVSLVPAILAAGVGIVLILLLIRHRRRKKQQNP